MNKIEKVVWTIIGVISLYMVIGVIVEWRTTPTVRPIPKETPTKVTPFPIIPCDGKCA